MNVLSLFDGMSCGQIALNRTGIKPAKYYAAELDKYAITVTQANFPETKQLGDVTQWRDWDIDWASIDLLIGGSPCQGFSFAGKQLAFNDPRSKLFFVYVDILNHIRSLNPGVKFLLENVKMKKEYLDVISERLGVEPVFINSALVSAQNRQRYYWANWGFCQPDDKGIVLADILESGAVDRDKSHCIDANYYKGGNLKSYFEKNRRQLVFNKPVRTGVIGKGRQGERIYSVLGKSPTLLCNPAGGNKPLYHGDIDDYRKLTPLECERLQTVEGGYTDHVSNTQRYKMLGNGFTVDVIAHIFKEMIK
jgi:DNA (cytosine-5)-methyltransferase 1